MKHAASRDSLGARATLACARGALGYFRIDRIGESGAADVSHLPFSVRILLETLLRHEDGRSVTLDHVVGLARDAGRGESKVDVPFLPARVLLQDFTGVPCIVDLAAMRSAAHRLGSSPGRVNPQIPVDLVIDHSVTVDLFGSREALLRNTQLELERNRERYQLLKWGQQAFDGLRVVPPSAGICHQVNLEHLAQVVRLSGQGDRVVAHPDTLLGTDSHTPMINGLGVLGWGVGGIEAEAAMLGEPSVFAAPEVVGLRLSGRLRAGCTSTDLVLTVAETLRRERVVGAFIECFGPGLSSMSVPDRATVSNMTPEHGATVTYFPVDHQTLRYLRETGRPAELVDLVERYCRAQGIFRTEETPEPVFARVVSMDLDSVEPSVAGPKRPHDRVALRQMRESWRSGLREGTAGARGLGLSEEQAGHEVELCDPKSGSRFSLRHGAVAIAAVTSCTNTSNPELMIAAGLLARRAVALGLRAKPWVKTSLAPGSRVVTAYLDAAGLTAPLEELGFHTVGYGCTTCIGNSGPLPAEMSKAIAEGGLVAAAVISGNRNFEARIHPQVRACYLASPPLVVAYALAGTVDVDLTSEPIARTEDGREVFLSDLWPAQEEVARLVTGSLRSEMFSRAYQGIDRSIEEWNRLEAPTGELYGWDEKSTYIREPPFFERLGAARGGIEPILGARVLVMVADAITTDHISPAGSIDPRSAAGAYLAELGVPQAQWNSYGSRRGNDRVMTRGTFANVRLRNLLAPGTEGGMTTHLPSGEVVRIFEAAERYRASGTPTIVLAGRDYGMGSSRDWAAKGAHLLGVRAVIARSFERIHRSNLVGMGVLPLQLAADEDTSTLGLTGREVFSIHLTDGLAPGQRIDVTAEAEDGRARRFSVTCRIDTEVEVDYFRGGGLLQHTLGRLLAVGA